MKMKIALLCAFLLVHGLITQAIAQNLQISGKVTSGTLEPLPGATIAVKGTNTVTNTNNEGNFTITIPGVGSVLQISYVGMVTKEVTVTGTGNLNIALESSDDALQEVVVVGYGTQRVTKVSGAISTIKAADIERRSPARAEEVLQGQAAGVNVIQSGSPGSKPTVLIRGIPSFSGTDPVVIIDGVPQTLTDFNSINPADIESINVLKDAATTAIYGVKGGNGVIVVTTKSGRRSGKTEISVNTNFGRQVVMNTIGVLNATEYAAMINEGSTLSGGNVIF